MINYKEENDLAGKRVQCYSSHYQHRLDVPISKRILQAKVNFLRKEFELAIETLDAWNYFDLISFDFTKDERRNGKN